MADDVPALLCSVSNNIEAVMVESLLKSNNIPVMTRWRYGGDIVMIYTGASSTGADLYVPSKLLEDAKALLLSEPIASETDDFDDQEFQEYAKQHELEKRAILRKLFVWLILLPLLIALIVIIWVLYIP